jgi:maltose O-acetyltransferase
MDWLRIQLWRVYVRWFRRDPARGLRRRGLVVGKNFDMLEGVQIDWSHCWRITIGDDVTLAPSVRILAHDASTKAYLGYTRIGKVTIGNRVFIGANSIVLPGVDIGDDVIIGAGSIVTHDIPDNTVAAGNPARPLGHTDEYIERRRREMAETPNFGRDYTLEQGITPAMRDEMNERIDRIGYVV